MKLLIVTTCLSVCFFTQNFAQKIDFKHDFETHAAGNLVQKTLREMGNRFNTLDEGMFSQKKRTRCSFLMLNNLARAAATINDKEAFECIISSLVDRTRVIETRDQYFIEMNEKADKSRRIVLKRA
jgi:hypothetical protein